MNKLVKLLKLPFRQQLLILEICSLLLLIETAIHLIPFKLLIRALGLSEQKQAPRVPHAKPLNAREAWKIGRYIEALAKKLPNKPKCLACALSAKIILQRRDIQSNIHFGLAKEANTNDLKAHAWLTTGNLCITGANVKDDYVQVYQLY